MKKLLLTLALIAATAFAFAQCNLPTYQWQNNKDRYVIADVPFTSAVYLFQWKDPDSTNWNWKEVMLHAISGVNCKLNPNNGNNPNIHYGTWQCTYTVGITENNNNPQYNLWGGMQDGWEHRFAVKCGNVYSSFSPTLTVDF